ncbi:BPI fold-containing family C protein-like isoform X1 [Ahaetulla prasina]|uniref:BPI fold-containing family C protein-like isoform X1 n=1 Tax=Ahaetulla prasina TaxID=499056 RepID=UPI002649C8CB|nr:BPI fold-containing family C protein-like isoform X1 [Ahaetulla prasina]XP_058047592.1 BPI fold-containing family C protein-like isoform X1 [Ahaetulla prasina]
MRFCLVFILLSLFLFQLEANPEVRIRITQRGLNYAKEIGMKLLEQELRTKIFPDEIGTEKFFFGKVDYTVSRIQITSISIYNSSVVLIPGNSIRLLIKNISVTVTTHWTLNSWLIDYQGEVEISILGLSITTNMIVAQNNRGDFLVSVQNCQLSTGNIEVQLNSEGRWFYNAFVQHLEKVIHTRLENQLCLNVILRIQKETEVLKGLKGVFQINPFIQVKYSLIKPPEVFKSYVDLDFKVSVYFSGNHTESPFVAAPFTLPEKNNYMLFGGISESLLNSITLTYYTTRVSKITFSEEHSSNFNLTTDILSRVIPQVMQHYAKSHPLRMKLMVTAAPVLRLQNNSFTIEIPCFVVVSALLSSAMIKPIFAVNASIGLKANAVIAKQKLIVLLQLQRLYLSLTYSSIGSFQVQRLKNFLSYSLQNTVIPPIAAALKRGLQLPRMAKLVFSEAVTEVNKGYILISTDLNYKY